MTLLVCVIVSGLVLVILGFRFDITKGQLQQDAIVQFATIPSGASVSIDGKAVNAKTPAKTALTPGEHAFSMVRDGYQPWSKTVSAKAGVLTWLNYALLVPKSLPLQSVAAYPTVDASLASPTGHTMLVQQKASEPSFQVVDLTSDDIKSTTVTIPQAVYSEATTAGVTHAFILKEWDQGGRYVLIQHTYGDKSEWLVLDSQNGAASRNITTTFDVALSDAHFSGTSGNILFALSSGDVRKLDLSAGTISRTLASNVTSFSLFKTNIITYIGTGRSGTNERVVGMYRDGDTNPEILRTTTSSSSVPLFVATTHYFNDDYIAIAEGQKVDITIGSYPTSSNDTTSLKAFASYTLSAAAERLEFSPTGQFVLTQSGTTMTSYDMEYHTLATSSIEGNGQLSHLKWLNDNYLWADRGGSLTIREFDGANVHTINPLVSGQDAVLTENGRFLYSFGTTTTGVQLQRVRMILQ